MTDSSFARARPRDAEPDSEEAFWRRLLHRWFMEYNPLYVLSAALVLGGILLISRGLARGDGDHASVIASAIAEVYAVALIAGAALLTRIGLRRPAVMLALLTVVYQGDLTLGTATSVYLGWVGTLSAAVWLALFVAKMHALAWAVQVKLSRSAILVPAFGAFGVALLPRLVSRGGDAASALVAAWVFALVASGQWSTREVQSKVSLDAWGRTVLQRSLRATWILYALLALMHVAFWVREYDLRASVFVPAALLLATRFVRTEARTWAAVAAALLFAAWCMPRDFWVAAAMAAAVLCLRAWRRPVRSSPTAEAPPESNVPYRTQERQKPPPPPPLETLFVRASGESMLRLMTGALIGVYLSLWTVGWTGGAWPAHFLPLDLLMGGAMLLIARLGRAPVALVPLVSTGLHAALQTGLVTAPESTLGWGVGSVTLGFAVLLGSLALSWLVRRRSAMPGFREEESWVRSRACDS